MCFLILVFNKNSKNKRENRKTWNYYIKLIWQVLAFKFSVVHQYFSLNFWRDCNIKLTANIKFK